MAVGAQMSHSGAQHLASVARWDCSPSFAKLEELVQLLGVMLLVGEDVSEQALLK